MDQMFSETGGPRTFWMVKLLPVLIRLARKKVFFIILVNFDIVSWLSASMLLWVIWLSSMLWPSYSWIRFW